MEELSPCPFCGGVAEVVDCTERTQGFLVSCQNCYTVLGEDFDYDKKLNRGLFDTKVEAVSAWNTRFKEPS